MDARVVERAAVGILRLCQRLLPYKPDVAEPLLRGLQVGAGPAWGMPCCAAAAASLLLLCELEVGAAPMHAPPAARMHAPTSALPRLTAARAQP